MRRRTLESLNAAVETMRQDTVNSIRMHSRIENGRPSFQSTGDIVANCITIPLIGRLHRWPFFNREKKRTKEISFQYVANIFVHSASRGW